VESLPYPGTSNIDCGSTAFNELMIGACCCLGVMWQMSAAGFGGMRRLGE
jgi:hypothetical protein